MKFNKKILIRILFWIVYSYALYMAIQAGWWLWLVIASPILFFIFYKEDIPQFNKSKKDSEDK